MYVYKQRTCVCHRCKGFFMKSTGIFITLFALTRSAFCAEIIKSIDFDTFDFATHFKNNMQTTLPLAISSHDPCVDISVSAQNEQRPHVKHIVSTSSLDTYTETSYEESEDKENIFLQTNVKKWGTHRKGKMSH